MKEGIRAALAMVFCASLPFLWFARRLLAILPCFRTLSIWTGQPIITVAKNSRVERSLGFRSTSVVRNTYYITNEFDLVLDNVASRLRIPLALVTYAYFVWICLAARQVHAYFDGGLLPSSRRRNFNALELIAYRFLGVRLFVWVYGADVRTHEATVKLGVPNCCSDCSQKKIACICDEDEWFANFERVKKIATAYFSMGDMIEYTPGSNNSLFFWPIDLSAQGGKRYQPSFPINEPKHPVRVVHAPNHREFKGTRYIEAAVAKLQAEELAIELVLVEKMSNEEALEIYRSADVIFDQCLIGFHGYFALEALALGKPVMCFIRDRERYLLAPAECPIIDTTIGSIEDDLRAIVIKRSELTEIGRRGRTYIEKYYTPEALAARLGKAYKELGVML